MKKFLRSLSLLLALLMLLGAFGTLISCTEEPTEPPTENPGPEDPDNGDPQNPQPPAPGPDGKAQYTISVKSIAGTPLANLMFLVYKGETLTTYGKTDANGIGTVSLVPANDYTVELSAPDGYITQDRYPFVGATANIVLTSAIISDSNLAGVSYKLGSIIRDFTVMTTDGTTFTLSDAFKNGKKAEYSVRIFDVNESSTGTKSGPSSNQE